MRWHQRPVALAVSVVAVAAVSFGAAAVTRHLNALPAGETYDVSATKAAIVRTAAEDHYTPGYGEGLPKACEIVPIGQRIDGPTTTVWVITLCRGLEDRSCNADKIGGYGSSARVTVVDDIVTRYEEPRELTRPSDPRSFEHLIPSKMRERTLSMMQDVPTRRADDRLLHRLCPGGVHPMS